MSWKPWFQIHSETVFNQSSPVIISRNQNQADVFKIGFDNVIWTTFWNRDIGWSPWFQIHPETVFDHEIGHVTAVSRNPDQIDLFVTGFDGAVWTTFWNPTDSWNGWFQIHPETVFNQRTPVTVISRNPDQLDLFKIGFDGAVWTTFWNPTNGWNTWFQVHPETVFDVNGTVSAISRNPDQIDLFVTGFDGAVWTTFWNPADGWNAWFQIHPENVFNQRTPVTVISRNPNQLDLFKIGFDGAAWTTFWNPTNGWNTWFQVHPETVFDVNGTVSAISRNPDQIDLFVTGFDGAVWTIFWNQTNGWNAWFQIHPETVFNQLTPVTCVARTPDHIDLFRIGFDNVLWSTWWEQDTFVTKLNLILHNVIEHDSDDTFLQGASDEVYASHGVAHDSADIYVENGITKITDHSVSITNQDLTHNESVPFPITVYSFDLLGKNIYPRKCTVTLLVIEEDNGSLEEDFNKLDKEFRGKIKEAVASKGSELLGAAGTSVAGPVGAFIGKEILGRAWEYLSGLGFDALFSAISEGLANELMPPFIFDIDIHDVNFRFAGNSLSSGILSLDYRGTGNSHYTLNYEWVLAT